MFLSPTLSYKCLSFEVHVWHIWIITIMTMITGLTGNVKVVVSWFILHQLLSCCYVYFLIFSYNTPRRSPGRGHNWLVVLVHHHFVGSLCCLIGLCKTFVPDLWKPCPVYLQTFQQIQHSPPTLATHSRCWPQCRGKNFCTSTLAHLKSLVFPHVQLPPLISKTPYAVLVIFSEIL